MLIHYKSMLRTILAGLLFTLGGLNLNANISASNNFQLLNDTILSGQNKPDLTSSFIPEKAKNETINFQVNSEISYLSFSHFVKNSSKQLFLSAWTKEKDARKLSNKTDSLRKAYANAPDDQKEKIAAKILEGEKMMMSLNEEIPGLYEKARDEENLYWQTAPGDEKTKFLGKIRSFRDSIRRAADLLNDQSSINTTVPDTITFFKAGKKAADRAEPVQAIVYKIQVGAFKGKMPDTAAKAIKKLGLLRKVESYKDEKGITVYTTGNLKTYQEALTLQGQVKLEGIKNAIIAAYNSGKRITLDEARKTNNEPLKP